MSREVVVMETGLIFLQIGVENRKKFSAINMFSIYAAMHSFELACVITKLIGGAKTRFNVLRNMQTCDGCR